MTAPALCRFDELTDGGVRLVGLEPPVGGLSSLLLLRSGSVVHAFANLCPHFGVPLAKRQEHLIFKPLASLSCNNHYARFRWSDGVCDFGDCEGEALRPVAVEVVGGEVRLSRPPEPG